MAFKHVMGSWLSAAAATHGMILRRTSRRGNTVTWPGMWATAAGANVAWAVRAAAGFTPVHVGLHANAFLLSSEMGGKRAKKLVYEVVVGAVHLFSFSSSRGKSLLELWGTTFLYD